MKNYKFITCNYEQKGYLAITDDVLKNIPLSDTYETFGQEVNSDQAGDSIELLTKEAVALANDWAKENEQDELYSVGDVVYAYDNFYLYTHLEINCNEEDVSFNKLGILGFNYWDGNNWRTVSVESDFDTTTHTVLQDIELESELNKAIKEATFVNESFGCKRYETDKYYIFENYTQGHFEAYEVIAKADYITHN